MFLMPVEDKRKKLLKITECFKSLLELFEDDEDRRILSPYYSKKNENKLNTSNSETTIFVKW